MKNSLLKLAAVIIISISSQSAKSQISDIQNLASGAADAFSGCGGADLGAGCDGVECCWNGGVFFFEYIFDHHEEIMKMRVDNPTLLSVELDFNAAYAMHYNPDSSQYYDYVNYLPHIRGNFGVISVDYRYNALVEYNNRIPDSFESWELLFMLNFIPSDWFKTSLGSGVYKEQYTGYYFNEFYFSMLFGLYHNKDFIDFDTRFAVDYTKSQYPFIEAGLRYKMRAVDLNHFYIYLTLGGIYQNYYQNHDIWAASAGLTFNIH